MLHDQTYFLRGRKATMGDFLSDLLKQAETAAKTELAKVPAQLTAAAASTIIKDPRVQTAAQQQAEKAALEKSVEALQQTKSDIAAQIALLKKDPINYIKSNPGKVALVIGGTLAAIMIPLLIVRGATK